jgi:DNA-binding beta-propeller fold protein YncE
VEAPLDVRGAASARFAVAPKVEVAGTGWKITFTASAYTDVEVAVLDAHGKIVRHLAAGLLGPNAPAPLQKDSLAQTLHWDGKNDAGSLNPEPRTLKPLQVRVRLGSAARLDQYLGWNSDIQDSIKGLVVGAGGELYVLLRSWVGQGRTELRVLDRSGKYLRTIMPYPAGTPAERTKSVGQLTVDGERIPVVFNGHGHSLSPLTVGMPTQNLAWNPRGYVVAASTLATSYEHGLPRHLLAFHPQGGAPDGLSFVGPELRPPTGITWGHGEGDDPCFERLATSPDGKWIYYTHTTFSSLHAIYRLAWGEDHGAGLEAAWFGLDSRPGSDEKHLNDPQGLAVDAAGNVYVCDRGNNRIAVISPDGQFRGALPVEDPEQIAVHPRSGEIYVLCRQASPGSNPKDTGPMDMDEYRSWKARVAERSAKAPPARAPKLLKLAAWKADAPAAESKVLARLDAGFGLMTLDPEAAPPRIWVTGKNGLQPIVDHGDRFESGASVGGGNKGLAHPGRVAADPDRNRVLVYNLASNYKVNAYDLTTGEKSQLLDSVSDFAIAPDSSIYGTGKFGSNQLLHFASDGKPLPFAGAATNVLKIAPTWIGGVNLGARGMTVSPAGEIYLLRGSTETGVHSRLDVYGPDGKLKKAALVDGLGLGDCGVAVDPAGNVYIGINVKPKDQLLPKAFDGLAPSANWLCWAQWSWHYRPPPWHYSMRNEYLYHYGSAMKFGPSGGALYGASIGYDQSGKPINGGRLPIEDAPTDSAEYLSGYLYGAVKAAGVQWRYAGMGIVPSSERMWGDPSCVCMTSRLAVDGFGRVFVPDCFRFSVAMLDTAGNQIARIGCYGNADDIDGIRFAWPAHVDAVDGLLCVADSVNRRIAAIRLAWAAEETVVVK